MARKSSGRTAPRPQQTQAEAPKRPEVKGAGKRSVISDLFGKKSLLAIELQLEWRASYFSGEDLAAAIEASPGQALPDRVRDYVCRYLRGEIKKKRGRKKVVSAGAELTLIWARIEYDEELKRLRNERKSRGRGAMTRGQLSAHQLAARTVQERSEQFRHMSTEGFLNLLSSRQKGS